MQKLCPWCNEVVEDRLCITKDDSENCRRKLVADVKAGRVSDGVASLSLMFMRPDRRHLKVIK